MVEFRPHHFLCTLGFEGKGYSEQFTQNYQDIADRLRAGDGSGDSIQIHVVAGSDAICGPCPNRRDSVCSGEEKIRRLDQAHSQALGIRPGDTLTWGDAKKLLAQKMSVEKFEAACAPCAWKAMGVCKAALLKVRAEHGVRDARDSDKTASAKTASDGPGGSFAPKSSRP